MCCKALTYHSWFELWSRFSMRISRMSGNGDSLLPPDWNGLNLFGIAIIFALIKLKSHLSTSLLSLDVPHRNHIQMIYKAKWKRLVWNQISFRLLRSRWNQPGTRQYLCIRLLSCLLIQTRYLEIDYLIQKFVWLFIAFYKSASRSKSSEEGKILPSLPVARAYFLNCIRRFLICSILYSYTASSQRLLLTSQTISENFQIQRHCYILLLVCNFPHHLGNIQFRNLQILLGIRDTCAQW